MAGTGPDGKGQSSHGHPRHHPSMHHSSRRNRLSRFRYYPGMEWLANVTTRHVPVCRHVRVAGQPGPIAIAPSRQGNVPYLCRVVHDGSGCPAARTWPEPNPHPGERCCAAHHLHRARGQPHRPRPIPVRAARSPVQTSGAEGSGMTPSTWSIFLASQSGSCRLIRREMA